MDSTCRWQGSGAGAFMRPVLRIARMEFDIDYNSHLRKT
jgi:hypothetical protein